MPEDLDVKEIARQDAIADKVFNNLGLDASTQRVATHQTLSLQDKFRLTGLEQEFRPPAPVSFDQGFMIDVASGIYNGLVIETAAGLSNIAPTIGQALGADSEFLDSWITNVTDFFDSQKLSYSDDAGLPINEFKDITSSHVAKGIGEGVGFIAAMFFGGGALASSAKAVKALGSASKASTLGGWLAGTALMYGSIQEEAKKAGLSNGDAARFALGLAGVIGATEQVTLGYLGKLSKGFISKVAQKEAINVLKTANTTNPVALQKLFLGGLGKAMAKTTNVAKGAAAEFTQEFSQTYIEEGAKQLWDTVYKDDKAKGEFGADVTNYQSFVEATFAGAIGGLLGGGMVFAGRRGGQEEGLFGYVNNSVQQNKPELITDLRGSLGTMLEDGRMSKKQFDASNDAITELENFAKDVKPKGIKDGVANYQLFQLNKLGKQAVDFAKDVKSNNEENPTLAKDDANRQGMIKQVQESINNNFESIFEGKKALTKDKTKFDGMLSDYGKLLTDIKNTVVSKEDFDKRLAKFEVKAKKETETKGDTKEDAKIVEAEELKKVEDVRTDEQIVEQKVEDEDVALKLQRLTEESGVNVIDDLFNDIPESVDRVMHRVENNIPADANAVSNASDILYKKYKQIEAMKGAKDKTLTNEQIDSVLEQLGNEIGVLEDYRTINYTEQDGKTDTRESNKEKIIKSKEQVEVKPDTKATEEVITDDQYKSFVDEGVVSDEVISSIAEKVKIKADLSERETAIFTDKTTEINDVLNSKEYGDEIKIKDSSLTPVFENGKYVYKNKKGEVSGNSVSITEKLSKIKGVVSSWWNSTLNAEKRKDVRNRAEHLLTLLLSLENDNISEESVIMTALQGVKFSKNVAKDLTNVNESKWISDEGHSIDTYVLNEVKDALVAEGFMAQETDINESYYIEYVKEIIQRHPNGITNANLKEAAVSKELQEISALNQEFSDEYGLDLATVAEEIVKDIENETESSKEQESSETESSSTEVAEKIDDEVPFQKEGIVKDKTDLASKNPKLFKKVADKFKKLFPSTPVEIVDKIVDKNGAEVLGRVYKAGIQISKDKAVQTTLIHENAEVFLELLGTDNKVVEAGFDLIRDTEYHKKAKEAYPELSEKGQLKEALIESLSQSTLEDLKTRFEGTKLEKFQAFLKRFWNRTKAMFNADDRNAMEMLRDDLLLRGEKVKTKKPKKYVKKDSRSKKAADKDNAFIEKLAKARQVFTDFGRTAFGSIHTKSLISNNPKVAGEIVDELKRLYPKLKVNKDGIVKDGRFVPLKEGEKGMHIRNAFESMVAWANDAYLETPPHEYAHAYIEMYAEHPLVKEAIKKYGSIEAVATIMGRNYAGKKVSNSFKTWLDKFWNMIKSLVGSPDIGYKLSEAFMKGEKLSSTEEPGFNTIEYQKKTAFKSNTKTGGVDTSGLVETEFKPMNTEESLQSLLGGVKDTIEIKSVIYGLVDDYKAIATDKQGTKTGYRNVVDKRLLADLKKWIKEDVHLKRVKDYLDGKNEFPNDKTGYINKISYEKILVDLVNAKRYEEAIENSIVMDDGKIYSVKELKVAEEISETAKKRKALYDKITWKPLRDAFKYLEKAMPYITNSRLVTKYLSGSENSTLSNIYYKAINFGENRRNSLISEFNDDLMIDSFSDVYRNWSAHRNPKSTIDELDTKVIQTQDGEIELTMAELLGFYLASRQERARIPMLKKGIIIDKEIDGRDIPLGKSFSLSEEQMVNIESMVKNDADLMKNVANIDKAMKAMSKAVANTYLRDNGINLTLEDDYMPVYSGETSYNERRSKSSIDDFKSINLALGEDEAIRIVDPMQVLDSYKVNAATYAALALPIKNNRKIIESIEKSYGSKSQEKIYIESLKETLNQLEDPAQLFSGQGEKQWTRNINKITSNFAVSVLGMNIPVMIKQSISFITAANEISGKYLTMAGGGVNAIPIINPKAIFKAIFDPLSKGSVRWDLDTNSGAFALMKKYSPAIKARIEGLSNRELGEVSMGEADGSDTITIPIKALWGGNKGKNMQFSKSRFMEGIRIFDAVTIENIWRAAEFEAEAEYDVKRGTDEFYEHVAVRVENIIAKTQPTFNLSDRTGLAKQSDFLSRGFTMFSSATSKMAMLQIDGMLDFIANPTRENQMKLIKRSTNILVITALATATIDMLKGMLMYGYDDDDELIKETLITAAANNIGLIHVVGQVARVTASQLDDKPWSTNVQTPFESLAQSAGGILANAAKGNIVTALHKSLELGFKASGLPMKGISLPRQTIKRAVGDK